MATELERRDFLSFTKRRPVARTGPSGSDGTSGANGLSAYQIAVKYGFRGTERQWLDSLVGSPGRSGSDGINGTTPTLEDPITLAQITALIDQRIEFWAGEATWRWREASGLQVKIEGSIIWAVLVPLIVDGELTLSYVPISTPGVGLVSKWEDEVGPQIKHPTEAVWYKFVPVVVDGQITLAFSSTDTETVWRWKWGAGPQVEIDELWYTLIPQLIDGEPTLGFSETGEA